MVCLVCQKPSVRTYLCSNCIVPYECAWFVGERKGVLQRLIGLYKFERAKAAHNVLGDLLLDILPELPSDTIIVPIPTTPSRIRERGYDHMLLIAKYIAKKRGLKCEQIIQRKTNTKQRNTSATIRTKQAKQAFKVNSVIDSSIPYLIIDDVMTTGATVRYASKALRDAGAKHVWVAIIARQVFGK